MTPLLLGAAGALAVILIVLGLSPAPEKPPTARIRFRDRVLQFAGLRDRGQRRARRVQVLVGLVVGAVAALGTGWFVLLLLVPAGAVVLPGLMRRAPDDAGLVKLTALETWSRSLVGLLESRSTLEDAIKGSQLSAPAAISPAVADLAARLRSGVRLETALRAFADDIDDPIGDTIAVSLRIGSTRPGGTAAALEELAEAVAGEVDARTQVNNERAGPRAGLRIIVLFVLGFLVLGATSGQAAQFTASYGTPLGQLVLLVLGAWVLACLVWVRRVMTSDPPQRLLAHRGSP